MFKPIMFWICLDTEKQFCLEVICGGTDIMNLIKVYQCVYIIYN